MGVETILEKIRQKSDQECREILETARQQSQQQSRQVLEQARQEARQRFSPRKSRRSSPFWVRPSSLGWKGKSPC